MDISTVEQLALPAVLEIKFSVDSMSVALSDGRTVLIPLAWYPRLAAAKKKELEHFEISPSGYGVHWPELDEDLSVYGFLFPAGAKSSSGLAPRR